MGESDSWNRLTSSSVLSSQDAEGELEIGDARVEWNGRAGGANDGMDDRWREQQGNNRVRRWMALGPGMGSAIGGDERRHDNI